MIASKIANPGFEPACAARSQRAELYEKLHSVGVSQTRKSFTWQMPRRGSAQAAEDASCSRYLGIRVPEVRINKPS